MQSEEVGYPPCNIEKSGDDTYRIVMAVAVFDKNGIEVVAEQNRLAVRGRVDGDNGTTHLHRGIATRAFERRFDLADFVEVAGAAMHDGLLVIDLKREVPEELKPRKIDIQTGKIAQAEPPKQLERSAA